MCNNNSSTNLLNEYQGIIGVVIGFLANLLITYLTNHIGKIHFFAYNWRITFYKKTGGGYIKSDFDESDKIEYQLDLDIYNSYNIPKSLRDINIVFENTYFPAISKPIDPALSRNYQSAIITSSLKIINLPPKTFVHQKLTGTVIKNETENYQFIKGSKVVLNALDYKGKIFKHLILTSVNIE